MKRSLVILASLVVVLAVCFVSYLKGHADGVHRSRAMHMGFDVSCLKKMEEGKLDWAKSDQALFLWSALNAEQNRLNWLAEWEDWRGVDADERLERYRPQAEAFVAKYRNTFATVGQIEAALEDKLGVPVESTIE